MMSETIGRRDLLMLMLGVSTDTRARSEISGITRLQKFLFLLTEETDITLSSEGFDFVAYKAGPYSARLYDDMELLENFGLVEAQVTSEATGAEVDELEFSDLMGDKVEGETTADAYEEKSFGLTAKGREVVKDLLSSKKYEPFIKGATSSIRERKPAWIIPE